MINLTTLTFLSSFLFLLATLSHSLPLTTDSRWIVDDTSGHRVKLRCANWPGHMEAMVPEGLDRQPVDDISKLIPQLGFNCVRLTWATWSFTRDGYQNLTVSQSFKKLGLTDARDGIMKNNPDLLHVGIHDAQAAVVNSLGEHGVMVVLDNHISTPMWCCSENDNNGFFGDSDFDPEEWIRGWKVVAERYKDNQWVVGLSLRNELRGSKQNVSVWFHYTQKCAKAIHAIDPKTLVIVSGLDYDSDLSFLKDRPYGLDLNKKLVFEFHWYSFTAGQQPKWLSEPINEMCTKSREWFQKQAGFLLTTSRNRTETYPLFLSEFGIDERGLNEADNRYFTCFCTIAAENDLDWAVWGLQGSYYQRDGIEGPTETYGVLDTTWSRPKNYDVLGRFNLLQHILQDSNDRAAQYYTLLYHPQTGRCGQVIGDDKVYQENCKQRSGWEHKGDGSPIRLRGTPMCLKAQGENLPVLVTEDCNDKMSRWSFLPPSELHIGTKDARGNDLCLEWQASDYYTFLTTKKCVLDGKVSSERQWFQLIPTNVDVEK
uniref:Glycoside hydrolase family 5 domain-containing protein n=1 Tax=Kalanchoe fedtschenkoi TaxID=63787 RepID=A0A7N0VII4_KALFE